MITEIRLIDFNDGCAFLQFRTVHGDWQMVPSINIEAFSQEEAIEIYRQRSELTFPETNK